MKCKHSVMSLYSHFGRTDFVGVKRNTTTTTMNDLVIDSAYYNNRRRRKKEVTTTCSTEYGPDSTDSSTSSGSPIQNQRGSSSGSGSGSDNSTPTPNTRHGLTLAHRTCSDHILYQNDVIKFNALSLRNDYHHQHHPKESPSVPQPLPLPLPRDVVSDNDEDNILYDGRSVSRDDSNGSGSGICLPFLVDIFPSTSMVVNTVHLRSVMTTITTTQRQSVHLLRDEYHLYDHFCFLQSVLLLGNVSNVFASLREHVFSGSGSSLGRRFRGGGSGSGSGGGSGGGHLNNLLSGLADSIMIKVANYLPVNFSESLVTVAFSTTTTTTVGSGSGTSPMVFSEAEQLLLALDHLMIQLHYPSPLSEIFTSTTITIYNNHMTFLLKVTLCRWTSEKLWKQSTSSASLLTQLCAIKRGNGSGSGSGDGDGSSGSGSGGGSGGGHLNNLLRLFHLIRRM